MVEAFRSRPLDSEAYPYVWLDALAVKCREADKRGYGTKRTIFLGDGSSHIWRLQAQYFPAAQACVDWYHVVEKLWEAPRARK
jgi:hypothetical protein